MENLKFKTDGVADDKYFVFNGQLKFKSPCCKSKMEFDFSNNHIEYINDHIGKSYDLDLMCDECGKEFVIPIKIKSVSYEVEIELDRNDLKEL